MPSLDDKSVPLSLPSARCSVVCVSGVCRGNGLQVWRPEVPVKFVGLVVSASLVLPVFCRTSTFYQVSLAQSALGEGWLDA